MLYKVYCKKVVLYFYKLSANNVTLYFTKHLTINCFTVLCKMFLMIQYSTTYNTHKPPFFMIGVLPGDIIPAPSVGYCYQEEGRVKVPWYMTGPWCLVFLDTEM